ncbi:MAG: aminopeptidase P family protein [Planctomycetes bacterium]|nr:aminopeptidase P family protein [Planctomycetota bacterium]
MDAIMNDFEISIEAAALNRKRLIEALPDAIIVVEGNDLLTRSGDTHYPFRQNSDFIFLSAFHHPGAALIIHPKGEILFIPEVDQKHLVWLGEAETTKSAKSDYKLRRVCYQGSFEQEFKKLADRYNLCYCAPKLMSKLKKLSSIKMNSKDYRSSLNRLRQYKQEGEIELMKRAANVTSSAHKELMKKLKPGMHEYELQAIFESHLTNEQMCHSFAPIVASGKNASVLHYEKNNQKLKKGQLLLVDAGAEAFGYAADVSRTIPVSGRYSKVQARLYSLVLQAQQKTIDFCRPGVSFADINECCSLSLREGLADMGIIRGSSKGIDKLKPEALFMPHGVSHMLGIDVHDVACFKQKRGEESRAAFKRMELGEDMAITVEPGLYFIKALLEDRKNLKKYSEVIDFKLVDRYKGFGGIRIEDDILITKRGNKVLTYAPKEIEEVEGCMERMT